MYGTANTTYYRRSSTVSKPKVKTDEKKVNQITSEHELQKACVAKLQAHNMLCFCTDVFNGMSFIKDIRFKAIYKGHMEKMGAKKGQPDLIVLHNGKCTFVEFKFGKGKKSADQEAFCSRLESMGYEVLEWRTLEECTQWILQTIDLNKTVEEE